MTRWNKGSWDFKPSIFIRSYIAKITVSWGKEVRDIITPAMIKKKSNLTFRVQAEHAVKIGSSCSLTYSNSCNSTLRSLSHQLHSFQNLNLLYFPDTSTVPQQKF